MRLIERQSYLLNNYGNSHELQLAMLVMIFKSRKIEHTLPGNFDMEKLTEGLDRYGSAPLASDVQELWNVADALGLKHKRVRAEVHIFPRQYKIVFHCYGD